jgi:hypothetical protein
METTKTKEHKKEAGGWADEKQNTSVLALNWNHILLSDDCLWRLQTTWECAGEKTGLLKTLLRAELDLKHPAS